MRKLIGGLIVGGLLAVTVPAMAQVQLQQAGIGDPLSLAASGALVPFVGSPWVSTLEVASPVGDNNAHMFFFDSSCARVGDSVGLPLTTNDIAFVQVVNSDPKSPGVLPSATSGLVTIAQSDPSGFQLLPLDTGHPIHVRMYLFNTSDGRSRILEPIILDTAEFGVPSGINLHTWSPLRRAATFFAPQHTAVVNTTLLLICPKNTIQNATTTTSGAFAIANGFPAIAPPFPASFSSDPLNGSLRARIYDTNEAFKRDVHFGCDCLREVTDLQISNFYADPEAANGTFTEVEANNIAPSVDFAFAGYRSVFTVGSPLNNFSGRLSNGSRPWLQGNATLNTQQR